MKPNDKKEFLKFVSSVKFPDGYASNIARCLRHDIVQVVCKFERIFPPAFFTSMMHVMVHLPEEALLAGPVNYRWMYPIERLLGELKKSVRNRAKPEGSIIEAWVQYESLTFYGINDAMPPSSPVSGFSSVAPSLSAVTSALSLRRHLRSFCSLPAVTVELPSQFRRFFPNLRWPISLSSGHHFRRLRYDFSTIFCALADGWLGFLEFSLYEIGIKTLGFGRFGNFKSGHFRPFFGMSDLIRRGRSMTTAPSSDPPAQSASAATAPALMDHVLVGPGASQALASSASSVAQPASARRRHRPTDTIDTTSTDGTGALGSQPAKKNTRGPCRQLKTAKVTRVTNSRISIGYDEHHRAAPTAELHSSLAHDIGHVVRTHFKVEVRGQLLANYNLEDLNEESLTYVNRLFAERYK
ncbi:hypothetical protein L3X38_041921 [Prunus dulcis]|uniref:DUF4218 domain-containing protein n=1 Tax=Prunus dulcis TaxID=3755 RepID=A0AAD4UVK4_PRUDU|nr:hypothetical protein L3X38_041921 [Prunus dulcis]